MRALSILISLSFIAYGQTYTISTFAGGGLPTSIQGTSASLGTIGGTAVDGSGNLYIANGQYGRVLRLDAATGVLSLVAGNGTHGFSGDGGPATSAQLTFPNGVALGPDGSLYIAEGVLNRIRKVSGGVITTVAGTGTGGFSGDGGSATGAQLSFPTAVAVSPAGDLYIGDTNNNRIRKVSAGIISTVAGGGSQTGESAPATSAQLRAPGGIAFDSAGNLYVSEESGQRVREISNGVISTVAGSGTQGFSGDGGPATAAQLNTPLGIALDSAGTLYIGDALNNRVRKVSGGLISTIAGTGVANFSGDNGPATSATLSSPQAISIDASGNIYVTDLSNHRVRKITKAGTISTIAGGGTQVGDNGPAVNAQLAQPTDVTAPPNGSVYITDSGNSSIRVVSNGVINDAAGNETPGFAGDGSSATSAELSLGGRSGVAVDAAGNLYFSDSGNNRVRKVSGGIISTVAGTGVAGFSGDNGPAGSAQLNSPAGVAVDGAGNLYVADNLNNRIRKISGGVITTIAGNGTQGFGGDNGPASAAALNAPLAVAVDAAGTLYIGDSGNYRVRKVAAGTITTVAGIGTQGFSGDTGPATSAQLGAFPAVALDSTGNLYIADFGNVRIRRVSGGTINTIAGTGTSGFSGDNGPALSGQFATPAGLAVDAAGRVYVADQGNNRIRMLSPAATCAYSVSPLSLQFPAAGGNVTVSIQTSAGCAWTVSGLPTWLTVSGASSGSGNGSIALVAGPNSGAALNATITIAGVSVTASQPAAGGSSTTPVISAVVNGASFVSGTTPNAFITISGVNLSPVSIDWSNDIANGKLPTSVAGVSVTIGGQPAYIEYVSPTQINAVAPDIGAGSFPVVVTNSFGVSAPFTTVSAVFGPAFFPLPGGHVVATRQDFSLAVKNGTYPVATTAAKPGDVIILWGTGFGPTTPSAPVGAEAPSTTTLLAANPVTVTVGGVNATVYGVALAPGFASTFQVAIQIPTTLADGEYPVIATVGGVPSPVNAATGLITVQK